MTQEELEEYEAILDRGHWAGTRFIPQPEDAARYHALQEAIVELRLKEKGRL